MVSPQSPAGQADQIRLSYKAGQCSREAAIRAIREAIGRDRLTDAGAAELLDNKHMPSERYAAIGMTARDSTGGAA